MSYLVVMRFAVGQALALVVAVSQEGFLTLSTHKMLQANPKPSTHTWLEEPSKSVDQHTQTVLRSARTLSKSDQFHPGRPAAASIQREESVEKCDREMVTRGFKWFGKK